MSVEFHCAWWVINFLHFSWNRETLCFLKLFQLIVPFILLSQFKIQNKRWEIGYFLRTILGLSMPSWVGFSWGISINMFIYALVTITLMVFSWLSSIKLVYSSVFSLAFFSSSNLSTSYSLIHLLESKHLS